MKIIKNNDNFVIYPFSIPLLEDVNGKGERHSTAAGNRFHAWLLEPVFGHLTANWVGAWRVVAVDIRVFVALRMAPTHRNFDASFVRRFFRIVQANLQKQLI